MGGSSFVIALPKSVHTEKGYKQAVHAPVYLK